MIGLEATFQRPAWEVNNVTKSVQENFLINLAERVRGESMLCILKKKEVVA